MNKKKQLEKGLAHFLLARQAHNRNTSNTSKLSSKSIPTLSQAKQITKGMRKKHQWKLQKRKQKLKETYDENCRLFVSIQNQKSYYDYFQKKATPKAKVTWVLPNLKRSCELRSQGRLSKSTQHKQEDYSRMKIAELLSRDKKQMRENRRYLQQKNQ